MVRPGDLITTKCGRCNDITGHVVMIVLDGQILRVECKACGSVHKYRDAAPKPKTRKEASVVRHVKAGQSREEAVEKVQRDARPARQPVAQAKARSKSAAAWHESMLRLGGETPKTYSMRDTFAPDDLVEHPVFGRGVVISVTKPDKMEILFEEGAKTLRCQA